VGEVGGLPDGSAEVVAERRPENFLGEPDGVLHFEALPDEEEIPVCVCEIALCADSEIVGTAEMRKPEFDDTELQWFCPLPSAGLGVDQGESLKIGCLLG